jgi:hypothetical protein
MSWSNIVNSINAVVQSALRNESEVISYLTADGDTLSSVPATVFSFGKTRENSEGLQLRNDIAVSVLVADLEGHTPGDGDSFTVGDTTFVYVNSEQFADTFTIYGERTLKRKFGQSNRLQS